VSSRRLFRCRTVILHKLVQVGELEYERDMPRQARVDAPGDG
jgi:hypothetical protein